MKKSIKKNNYNIFTYTDFSWCRWFDCFNCNSLV